MPKSTRVALRCFAAAVASALAMAARAEGRPAAPPAPSAPQAPTLDGSHVPDAPVMRAQVETLIDRFTEAAEPDVSRLRDFAAAGSSEKRGDDAAPAAPTAFQTAFRDTLSLGPAALPVLLDHVTDARPTRFVVHWPASYVAHWPGNIGYANVFDARPYDRVQRPAGTKHFDNTMPSRADLFSKYTMTVGDICYLAIGRIVDRAYMSWPFHPHAIIEIDSPVHCPALAAAVRAEWSGLTPDAHRRSLIHDVYYPNDQPFEPDPLPDLCHYYPDAAEGVVTALLERPVCTDGLAERFVEDILDRPDFSKADIRDVSAVLAELNGRGPRSHVGAYVMRHIGPTVWDLPVRFALSDNDGVAEVLTVAMSKGALYSPDAFAGVRLRSETRRMLASHPTGYGLLWTNRYLLEDAFPHVLARRRAPADGPAEWRGGLARFTKEYGTANGDYVQTEMLRECVREAGDRDPGADRALAIQTALYPTGGAGRPRFVNAAELGDQVDIVLSLDGFHSARVDRDVSILLKRVAAIFAAIRRSLTLDAEHVDDLCFAGRTFAEHLDGRPAYATIWRTFYQTAISVVQFEMQADRRKEGEQGDYSGLSDDLARLNWDAGGRQGPDPVHVES
jgi:hypothetical protein